MKKSSQSEIIKKALEDALGGSDSENDKIVSKVLGVLDVQRLLRYQDKDTIGLLSTPGRVLVALLENPNTTLRGIAVYLDLSETMIDRTIKALISAGLVTKTKSQRQNLYKVNISLLKIHPDIHHFFNAIHGLFITESDKKVVDEDPF